MPPKKYQSFLSYYNDFKDKIYSYFLYRVGFDIKTAEDLTADVFLKAFKNFKKFNPDRSFQAWIYAISRHHLINYYKSSRQQVSLDEAINISADEAKQVEDLLEFERVVKAMNGLRENYQEPLMMRYLEGLTNREIATVLNKEEGTIRARISRGLTQLRKILAD